MKLNVIYQDEDVLVVYKEPNISAQEERGGKMDMPSLIKNYLVSKGQKPQVFVVHRLDKPVAGIMVYALNQRSAAKLSKSISNKDFLKKYFAVSENIPEGRREGELRNYLLKDGKTNTSGVVNKGTPNSKEAVLKYKVVRDFIYQNQKLYLNEVELCTGRHHQIRVQFNEAMSPLYGDIKYNADAIAKEQREGVALCAAFLEFEHPTTGKKLRFEIMPTNSIFPKAF